MHSHHGFVPSKFRWIFWGFVAVAVFFLWTEHKAHLLGALPYLFFLACPLMHLFMHHGHSNKTEDNSSNAKDESGKGDKS
ncbi:DUF2933 domain-containing protein [Aquitalea pelogenes]|uniref:DUF2933 domain-containing protein n=1 Tax=Aquitalea pelogenes TaxID=1293573 RepID=UPI0009E77557|nr:DUF2933 domain-containing protein [Aquitalea pelogenes]